MGSRSNAAGEITQITYPSGRVLHQSYDYVGRLCEVASQTSICGSSSSPYSTAYSYNAADQLLSFKYGNGVVGNWSYDPASTMLSSLSYTNPSQSCLNNSQTCFSLNYYYQNDSANCSNAPSKNNGQLDCIKDNVDSGRSVGYTYDSLGRISTAVTTGSANFAKWGISWSFDRYNNRLSQGIISGCVAPMTCPTNSLSFANPGGAQTNQPDGMCFDSAGNILSKTTKPCPSPTFAYDAENRMTTYMNTGGIYTYDDNGLRVKKVALGTTTVIIYSNGQDIAEYDNGAAASSPSREFVYAGSDILATVSAGKTTYHHKDQLSVRVWTDGTTGSPTYGQVIGQQGSYPYGESWYTTGSSAPDNFLFTSYARDSESGLDYALARYYDNTMGRFCSADPVLGSQDDPQSWNRYAYVRNDPINKADPSGKFWEFLAELFVDLFSSLFSSGAGEASLGAALGQTADITVVVTADAITIPTAELAITGGLAAGAGAAAATQGSNLLENLVKDSQGKAEKGVQKDPCKTFVQNLLAKLNKGTPGIGNSSAASFAKRIAKSTFKISPVPFMGPTGPDPSTVATTPLGSFRPTFYPSAFSHGYDLSEVYTHEAFHMGPLGKDDIDIYNAMFDTAHKPHLPLTGTHEEQVNQASARWNAELEKNCGSKAGQ